MHLCSDWCNGAKLFFLVINFRVCYTTATGPSGSVCTMKPNQWNKKDRNSLITEKDSMLSCLVSCRSSHAICINMLLQDIMLSFTHSWNIGLTWNKTVYLQPASTHFCKACPPFNLDEVLVAAAAEGIMKNYFSEHYIHNMHSVVD